MSPAAPTFDLATWHHRAGNLQTAEQLYRQALDRDPRHADAWHGLGLLAKQVGRLDVAAESIRQCLSLNPNCAPAHFNLGNILFDDAQLEDAEVCYRAVVRLTPTLVEAHTNLGNVLKHQGRLDEAEVCLLEAVRIKPDFADGHFNLALYWLLRGEFSKGWPEFEWRRRTQDNLPHGYHPPTWDGTALGGKTILLQVEEGLGDTVQFVRYARLVKEKGGRVVLQCQPAMAGLLAGCQGADELVPRGAPLPTCHVSAPLLSLPLLHGTTLATVPDEVPYLKVDPARVEAWRERLAALPGFKAGICWQGNPAHQNDRRRSVPLVQFAPLAAIPGVTLIVLQRGPGLEQLDGANARLTVVDLAGRSEDLAESWLDTAAIINALDLVITVDTAVAHLAGALGAPVWVPLPWMPDWRWLLDRDDSPWYPTMRLFRQPRAGDWTVVFEHMAEELRKFISL